jgi:LmbE family N-acetylglucosaminyl deacetylase
MNHLFLSPHLDDVVLSCGGMIAELITAADNVTVFNVFSGYASPPYSKSAQVLHQLWGSPVNVIRLRRAEDEAALAKLGAAAYFEDFPEALYRRDNESHWLYNDNTAILRDHHPADDL